MWFLPFLSLVGDNLGWSTLAASCRPAPGIEPLVHHDRQSGTGPSPPCSRACLGPSCTAHTDLCRLSLCGHVSGPPPIALRDLLLRDPAAARCDPLPFSLLSSVSTSLPRSLAPNQATCQPIATWVSPGRTPGQRSHGRGLAAADSRASVLADPQPAWGPLQTSSSFHFRERYQWRQLKAFLKSNITSEASELVGPPILPKTLQTQNKRGPFSMTSCSHPPPLFEAVQCSPVGLSRCRSWAIA